MNRILTVAHPKTGEHFAVEVGPSDFYEGQDRILRVAGPMVIAEADPEGWLANVDGEDAELDADWLSAELAEKAGISESEVYGATLAGILQDVTVIASPYGDPNATL